MRCNMQCTIEEYKEIGSTKTIKLEDLIALYKEGDALREEPYASRQGKKWRMQAQKWQEKVKKEIAKDASIEGERLLFLFNYPEAVLSLCEAAPTSYIYYLSHCERLAIIHSFIKDGRFLGADGFTYFYRPIQAPSVADEDRKEMSRKACTARTTGHWVIGKEVK